MLKLLLLSFFSVGLLSGVDIQTELLKNGMSYKVFNSDIVFEKDQIKFILQSNTDEAIKIFSKSNDGNKELIQLFQINANEKVSFPSNDQYIVLDSQSDRLTFYFETQNETKSIILYTNPKVAVIKPEENFEFFVDNQKVYIDQSKVISNHRGAKEANIIIPKLESSTVIISSKGFIGAGVIINNGKNIVTNYHVVEPDEQNIYVASKPNNFYKAKLIKVDMKKDLALLELPKELQLNHNFLSLQFANIKDIKKGIDIYTMGHPHKYYFAFEYGMLTNTLENHQWNQFQAKKVLQYSMNSNKGNSGGAIVNDKLELLGIVAGSDISGQNLNFGISIDDIKEFLSAKSDVRFEKKSANSYKSQIVQQGMYKNRMFAKLDRDGNGKYDAMMEDINKDGVWDIIAYDTNEDGLFERVTNY